MGTIDVTYALDSPASEVGPRLLGLAEDQWFDRKSIRVSVEKVAHAEIAFANAEGGILVVGLGDGRVEGIGSAAKHVNALTQAAIDHTLPPVRHRCRRVACVNDDGEPDELLVIEVESSDVVHANRRDEVFLRVGDEVRRLTFEQRRELLFDKGQANYETQAVAGAGLGLVDDAVAREYADKAGAQSVPGLLRARALADGDLLTVAGLLLFGEYPQRFLPEAYVRVLRYQGSARGSGARQRLVKDQRCEGPIPVQIREATYVVRDVQPTRRALGSKGRFADVPLVPEDAWLEALVNAVVHRSYSMAGDHIRLDVFDDRIEVHSPGRFPGLVRLDDPLNAIRFARNPRIARVAADLEFGQELGEGIRRMFEEMRAAGLNDPVYRQTSGSVEVTLSGEPRDRALDASLPEETRVIVAALREADRLSTGEVAEVLGRSRPLAIRRLEALREAGVVQWVGKSARDPRAYWRLP
jgi:ATP-dependent DNA helicase RecG